MATGIFTYADALAAGAVALTGAWVGPGDFAGHDAIYSEESGAILTIKFRGTEIDLGGFTTSIAGTRQSIDGGAFFTPTEGSQGGWHNDTYVVSGLGEGDHTVQIKWDQGGLYFIFKTGITGGDTFATVTGDTPALLNDAGTPTLPVAHLAIISAPTHGSISGTTVSVPGPCIAGGVTTVSYAWYHADEAHLLGSGPGTAIAGKSGTVANTGTEGSPVAIPDLSWDVPSDFHNQGLYLYCKISDGVNTFNVGLSTLYTDEGQFGVYVPAWIPDPTVPDDAALNALFDWSLAPEDGIALAGMGDSITNYIGDEFQAVLSGLDGASGKIVFGNGGHPGSTWEDWLPDATGGASNSSLLGNRLEGTAFSAYNNYTALKYWLQDRISEGKTPLLNLMLGTNNNDASTTSAVAILAQIQTDFPGIITIWHGLMFGFGISFNLYKANFALKEVAYQALTDGETIFDGTHKTHAWFVDNYDMTDGGLHPAGPDSAGQFQAARLWAEKVLPVFAATLTPTIETPGDTEPMILTPLGDHTSAPLLNVQTLERPDTATVLLLQCHSPEGSLRYTLDGSTPSLTHGFVLFSNTSVTLAIDESATVILFSSSSLIEINYQWGKY